MITKASAVVGGVLGLIMALAIFQLVNALWLLPAARSEGREMERADALKKSMELIKKRGETNAEINALDDSSLCRELLGKWVRDHCE